MTVSDWVSNGRYPNPVMRVGREARRTVWLQFGEVPSDSDRLIGLMDSPELANAVVTAVNAAYELGAYFQSEAATAPDDAHTAWVLALLRPVLDTGLDAGRFED